MVRKVREALEGLSTTGATPEQIQKTLKIFGETSTEYSPSEKKNDLEDRLAKVGEMLQKRDDAIEFLKKENARLKAELGAR
jgi:ABC-type hemin transport system substrate-binding protein